MLIYFCLYLFLLYIVKGDEFEKYLTRNETKLYYLNRTFNEDPENPYCSICCLLISNRTAIKDCGRHTLCRYKDEKPGPSCKGLIRVHFSDEEKNVIVDAHNTLRNKVAQGEEQRGNPGPQPTAANMRIIEWNYELEVLANRWAGQCVFAHDICRDVKQFPVGQNIGKSNYPVKKDLYFIRNWYENVNFIDSSIIRNYQLMSNDVLSQYTQLLWAETYQIGCARVTFQQASGLYREQFICNYGPTGNIPGQTVYKIGEPCTQCPEGTACAVQYSGLCGSEEIYELAYNKNNLKPYPLKNVDDGSNWTSILNLYVLFLMSIFVIF